MADGDALFGARPVDEAAFKEGLSRWATGVAVVTCWHESRPWGLAVSSFTSVSVTPPRVLFCLAKANRSAAAFRAATEVGISLLPDAANGVAARFSGSAPHAERFDADWSLDPSTPPWLRAGLAHFTGHVRCRMDAGTHIIVVVDVRTTRLGEGDPLIYAARAYRRLAHACPG